jgi:3-oxoacyl-[acyl-carrier protein] reductase
MKESERTTGGSVVLVTGAARGIGLAIAERFAKDGARVAMVDSDATEVSEAAGRVRSGGGSADAFTCDVTDPSAIDALLEEIGANPDVLVNNAGIFDLFIGATEMTLETWRRVMEVNVTGPFLLCQAIIPKMITAGQGSIVNISSICGLVGGSGGVAYTASKHAIIGLTRQLAHEYGAQGVRVNAVCPGVIATGVSLPLFANPELSEYTSAMMRRIPSGRNGEATEVADLVAFLSSPRASYIQGAAIPVDGGWTAI